MIENWQRTFTYPMDMPLFSGAFIIDGWTKTIPGYTRPPKIHRLFPLNMSPGVIIGSFKPSYLPFRTWVFGKDVAENPDGEFLKITAEMMGARLKPISIFNFLLSIAGPVQVISPVTVGYQPDLTFAYRAQEKTEAEIRALVEKQGPITTFKCGVCSLGLRVDYVGGYVINLSGELKRVLSVKVASVEPIKVKGVIAGPKDPYPLTDILRFFYFESHDFVANPEEIDRDITFCENADIKDTIVTPPSGTKLTPHSQVTITAEAMPGRELTSFIVKGVEYVGLEHSDAYYKPPSFTSVSIGDDGIVTAEMDPDARVEYIEPTPTKITITINAGDEDFCVLAHSSDRIIELPPGQAGSFITAVLATDECYPGKTWEVLDGGGFVAIRLDDSPGLSQNTLSFFIPEDMEPGIHEIKVRLNGKTQVIDYTLRILVEPLVITHEWELIQEFDLGITDLIRTSDYTTIYFCTDTSIYKTNLRMDFIEKMPLSGGSVTRGFMGIAEASAGRIVAMDDSNAWLLNNATGVFEKTTMTKASSGSFAGKGITADPDSPYVCLHESNALGWRGAVVVYNLDDPGETPVTLEVIDSGTNGWVNRKGVYAGDDKFIFVSYSQRSSSVPVATVDCAAKTRVYGHRFNAAGSFTLARLPSGDLGMMYYNGSNLMLAVSQDEGATFNDLHILHPSSSIFGYQFKQINDDVYLFTRDNLMYYTDDAFDTTGIVVSYGSPVDHISSRITFTNGGGLVWGNRRGLFMSVPNEVVKYKVTFTITESDTTPITDAVITLNGVTNAAGNYEFTDLMPGLEFEYIITRADFVTVTDTFQQPKEDETVNVVMEAV